jgi:4-diphosphocytidyl-2-C-methyl-D-erythritol kinase
MNKYIVSKSPAKLNLFLDIVKKRKDGFHDISTVFKIRFLSAKQSLKISLKSDGYKIPLGCENTMYKTAVLFAEQTGIQNGIVEIFIKKNIPPGSGLGGASSNAANVLLALNKIFGNKLDYARMYSIMTSIGSDTAFFLNKDSFALGMDKGHRLRALKTRIKLYHVIVFPGIKVSSGEAYGLYDKKSSILTNNRPDVKLLIYALNKNNKDKLSKNLYNIFENIIFDKLKKLEEIKSILIKYGAKNALLTGSGSAVYGVFFSENSALKAKKAIEKDNSFSLKVQGPFKTLE